jgi:Protein of unknown function (DUF2845)
MKRALLAIAVLSAACVASANETMRCAKWVVDSDATVTELLAKCGEPKSKEVKTDEVRRRRDVGSGTFAVGTTTTERWLYDRGPEAFRMIVTIVDGKIKSIDRAE